MFHVHPCQIQNVIEFHVRFKFAFLILRQMSGVLECLRTPQQALHNTQVFPERSRARLDSSSGLPWKLPRNTKVVRRDIYPMFGVK